MVQPDSVETKRRKASSVRHTRAIQRDRDKRPHSLPTDEQITRRLQDLTEPALMQQVGYFRELGLRERVLTLPIMLGLVLSMIWRHVGVANALVRLIRTESQLWVTPRRITQQAFSQRMGSLPATLFLNVLQAVLPQLQARWQQRERRPLPPELAWARQHYSDVLVVDGSTLDALVRRVGLLREDETHPLAGRMTALLSVLSHVPRQIWFEPDPQAHDQRAWEAVRAALPAGGLVLFDLGYTNFAVFAQLTAAAVAWLTRAKNNLVYTVVQTIQTRASVHDQLVWIGDGSTRQLVRLVSVLYRGQWHRYLTNVVEPERLPTIYVEALYGQRWRIEDAYLVVKRLLGLAYFWTGSQNGIELQLWATWLLYAVLADLTDAVADELRMPFARISLEMVYRGLYFVTTAIQRGETDDTIAYLSANADWLGLIKRQPKPKSPPPAILPNSP